MPEAPIPDDVKGLLTFPENKIRNFVCKEKVLEGMMWLQVYDAKTMSNTPVVQVGMPQPVPLGFHGTFLHHQQLKQQRMDE